MNDDLPPQAPPSEEGGPSKRAYTMTPLARAQRKQAALKSTGPRTEEGKAIASRNAWKHGEYSAVNQGALLAHSAAGNFGKPCRTTCPKHPENPNAPEHPCTLVLDGLTKAGGDCLDKEIYVRSFDAILQALETEGMDGMNGVLAGEAAGAVEVLNQLRGEIAEHGVMMARPIFDADGNAVVDSKTSEPVYHYVINPALAHYTKLLEKLGINLPQLLATPAARKRVGDPENPADPVSDMFRSLLNRAGGKPVLRGDTVDGEFSEVKK